MDMHGTCHGTCMIDVICRRLVMGIWVVLWHYYMGEPMLSIISIITAKQYYTSLQGHTMPYVHYAICRLQWHMDAMQGVQLDDRTWWDYMACISNMTYLWRMGSHHIVEAALKAHIMVDTTDRSHTMTCHVCMHNVLRNAMVALSICLIVCRYAWLSVDMLDGLWECTSHGDALPICIWCIGNIGQRCIVLLEAAMFTSFKDSHYMLLPLPGMHAHPANLIDSE